MRERVEGYRGEKVGGSAVIHNCFKIARGPGSCHRDRSAALASAGVCAC